MRLFSNRLYHLTQVYATKRCLHIKSQFPELFKQLVNETSFLDQIYNKVPPRQRLWHVENDINHVVTCKTCNTPVKWNKDKYRTYCCKKCRAQDPEVEQKRESTCFKTYGTKSTAQNEKVKLKQQQTNLQRYGAISPSLNKEIRNKQIETLFTNYGATLPFESEQIRNKIKTTFLQKYGTTSFGQITETPQIVNKKRKGRQQKWWYEKKLQQIKLVAEPQFDFDQYVDSVEQMPYECVTCNQQFYDSVRDGTLPRCPNCYPYRQTYFIESQVSDFLETYNIEHKRNDRTIITPQELDIVCPQSKLAIEFNGLYWHSLKYKPKNYHLNKTIYANKQGYALFHIFEDEWVNKQQIVKSMILNRLGFSSRIYARNCSIVYLNNQAKNQFLENNHIQGSDNSTIAIGLEHQGQLVSVMTFSRSRYTNKADYEMIRFCNIQNTTIVGGASKLFNKFINDTKPNSVISYSDLRFSNGEVYEKLGFNFSHQTKPGYWYVDVNQGCTKRCSRIAFQKHKLSDKLQYFDPKLTEQQNMENNNMYRIYDCGHNAYIWEK